MPKFEYTPQAKELMKHLGDKVDELELQQYAKKQFKIGGNMIHCYLVDKVENN